MTSEDILVLREQIRRLRAERNEAVQDAAIWRKDVENMRAERTAWQKQIAELKTERDHLKDLVRWAQIVSEDLQATLKRSGATDTVIFDVPRA